MFFSGNKLFLFLFVLLAGSSAAFGSAGKPVDSGATAWMLTSTALVLLMVPGLAMFYGGLVRSKNVMGTIMHSYIAMGIILGNSRVQSLFREKHSWRMVRVE